jgi:hypothetical protein
MRTRFLLGLALLAGCGGDEESTDCAAARGTPRPLPEAKLFFEYNATDEDTGIHGLFDASGWSELCVTGPNGQRFLAVKPQGALRDHNLGGFFFESREPSAADEPQAEVLARFPAGEYRAVGTATSGESLLGIARLTHDLPAAPAILAPADGEVVSPSNLVVRWEPVARTVAGGPVTITGYEVIVTNDDKDGADPNGMSQPIASIHVVPAVNRLSIPSEFLEPATSYELEVIAMETSGNQTIAARFFRTP